MDKSGYDFVIMVKGIASLVKEMVLENIRGLLEHEKLQYTKVWSVWDYSKEKAVYV